MPESLISALIQAPFVLVMAYLVHRFLAHLNARDAEWRGFMAQMQDSFGDRLDDLTEAIDHLTEIVITHDAATRAAARRSAGDNGDLPPITVRRIR